MANTNNNARKASRVTAQDVVLCLTLDGIDAVRALHDRDGIAVATFGKAVEMLNSKGRTDDGNVLADLCDELFPEQGTGERGRPAARTGETRAYSVQQVGEGACFIRLPVDLLGARKGSNVRVTFGADGITVRM